MIWVKTKCDCGGASDTERGPTTTTLTPGTDETGKGRAR